MLRSFVVLTMMFSFALAASGADKEDARTLDGTWIPVEAELAGRKFPDQFLKMMTLTMSEGKYAVIAGEKSDKGTIKLDPTAQPKTIDITGTEGPNAGKTILGIYERTGDTLRICYDLEDKKRPTEFKTVKDTKQFLVTYKREKK